MRIYPHIGSFHVGWYGSVMRDTERRPWSTLLITQQGVKWEFLIPGGDHQKIIDLELQAADEIA